VANVNDDPETNKLGAKYAVDFLLHARTASLESALDIGKWVLASSLAINAGGAVASVSAAEHHPDVAAVAVAFVTGIVVTVLAAFYRARVAIWAANQMHAVIAYWVGVQHYGVRYEDIEAGHPALAKKISWYEWLTFIFVAFSLGLFLSGVIMFAKISRQDEVSTRSVCERVEREMFAPQPTVSDAPAVFEALKCRATGHYKPTVRPHPPR
jgi:hypothetical protein